jgi:Spy/CpxP family protein refolding chaperone
MNRRALGIVALLSTFFAGAAAGAAVTRLWSRTQMNATLKTGDMSGVLDDLQLSSQQRLNADSILARSEPQTEATMRELAERLAWIADSVDAQLRATLTPEQRRRLDQMQRKPLFVLKHKSKTGSEVLDTVVPARSGSSSAVRHTPTSPP